jgi:hypothetical protein
MLQNHAGRRVSDGLHDLEVSGPAGRLVTVANILAMFRLVKDMRPNDKVLIIAFAVCAAILFDDHLAFTVNFQPTPVSSIMIGKLTGGLCAGVLAVCSQIAGNGTAGTNTPPTNALGPVDLGREHLRRLPIRMDAPIAMTSVILATRVRRS